MIRTCRRCGCTDVGTEWVTPDLCGACLPHLADEPDDDVPFDDDPTGEFIADPPGGEG